jgi:endonuclease/exonuclease/phosphatase family metal-dependent hydrolase
LAERYPDLIKSNGGGANAILVRDLPIQAHRVQRLAWWPERRWVHAVQLDRLWVANLHAAASDEQARLAAGSTLAWAGDSPAILGGDFNLRAVHVDGFHAAASHHVDHVLVHRLAPAGEATVLEHGHLSDHDPVLVEIELPA